MTEWQPIETAPRDGTEILAAQLVRETEWIRQVCVFFAGEWMVSWDHRSMDPSHWMPLPEPPEGDQG